MLYFFDGTKEGFLTAFARAYTDENAWLTSKKTQLVLGQELILVQTNAQTAKKCLERLCTFDKKASYELDTLLRSGMEEHEQIAFRYFRYMAQKKRPVHNELAVTAVFAANECMAKIGKEIHRFHGFIRFMETASGALYAPFAPDNDICDLLTAHFVARLPEYPFVLHDVTRKKAAVYDGKSVFTAPLSEADVLLSADEKSWQALWKRYYAAVNIPCRERLKQMRGYMPTRYHPFLIERN